MRAVARRFGREVHCHRALLSVEPMPGVPMQQALQRFPMNERRSAMLWLTRSGPFWDDVRRHGVGDWLECRGEIVTDSAVGEAAYRSLHGVECALLSVRPSAWDFSPVAVAWRRGDSAREEGRNTDLENWRDPAALEGGLRDAAPPIKSWDELRDASTDRFHNLNFSRYCFEPLAGVPFNRSATERIVALLDTLDRFACAFDAGGARTLEGHRMYRDYFTGDNALFSDSSVTEKREFRRELTFPHPTMPRSSLFCPWHGKVRSSPPLRLHFVWPIRADEPVHVVYAGPKLTRR